MQTTNLRLVREKSAVVDLMSHSSPIYVKPREFPLPSGAPIRGSLMYHSRPSTTVQQSEIPISGHYLTWFYFFLTKMLIKNRSNRCQKSIFVEIFAHSFPPDHEKETSFCQNCFTTLTFASKYAILVDCIYEDCEQSTRLLME